MQPNSDDAMWMRRAIELAMLGQGSVEPNPMVGCVIVQRGKLIGQGAHLVFGGPHAEVNAINSLENKSLDDATVYVTLEPCCHHGKTPPCVDLLLRHRPARVVIGLQDPFSEVNGGGIAKLKEAGIDVTVGVEESVARNLVRPFLKRVSNGLPWVIAKWAMTLDGRIATSSGDSQWISNTTSRTLVHQVRGRVDAVVVGIGTALHDDPMLNARPAGPRNACRIVLDSSARLPLNSRLVSTAKEHPTMVVCGPSTNSEKVEQLRQHGCEVWSTKSTDRNERVHELLKELGARGMTNILVEGGASVLGAFLDADQVDEVHVFIAPSLLGGAQALSPVGGLGAIKMAMAKKFESHSWQELDGDLYFRGRIATLQRREA